MLCRKCMRDKPEDQFYTYDLARKAYRCKECAKKKAREYKARKRKENLAAWVQHDRAYRKRRYHENPDRAANATLQMKYGISLEGYEELLKRQNGICLLCKRPPGKRRLSVDHNHKTGKIRGLLCNNCNRGIGHLRDDPTLLREAANYLEEHDE